MSESEWWTVPEAAGHLKVSENAVYAAIRAGQIPVLHVGTQPRINPVALAQWTLERARIAELSKSGYGVTVLQDKLIAAREWVEPATHTAAPTPPVTDRLTPKRIKTAAWRRTGHELGS